MTDEILERKFNNPQKERRFATPLSANQRRGFQYFLDYYPQIAEERKDGHGLADQNNVPLTNAERKIKEKVGKIFSHFSTYTFFEDLEKLGMDNPSF